MPIEKYTDLLVLLFLALFVPAGLGQDASAGTTVPGSDERVLYQFLGNADGHHPVGGVILGQGGKIYGTTIDGGSSHCGTVYQLNFSIFWKQTILHSFACGPGDGSKPREGLVLDRFGNLYGVTSTGGAFGHGIVFKLTPSSSGWSETVMHDFAGGNDGDSPSSSLVLDRSDNLYGVTFFGGSANCIGHGCGTVFEMEQTTSGWSESLLYTFDGADGKQPRSLVFDNSGNLYGVILNGGEFGGGTIFKLSHAMSGWEEAVLYSFTGRADGTHPWGGLVFDSAGNLYGTTAGKIFGSCSAPTCGTVFELQPQAGIWKLKTLYTFQGADGATPLGGLISDAAGNLFGTTLNGGAFSVGSVFELSPSATGWTETLLHSFPYSSLADDDGKHPASGLAIDQTGKLFGTAEDGPYGDGSVFAIKP